MSRSDWPELVGLLQIRAGAYPNLSAKPSVGWREAEKKIRQDYPKICIQVLAEGSCCTQDFCEERVRLFIDEQDKITRPPTIG